MPCNDCSRQEDCPPCVNGEDVTEWSSLEEEAKKRTRQVGPRCAVEVFLSHLHPEDVRAIEKVLSNPNLTTAGIQRAISDHLGLIAPTVWSIGNHRRGNCRCNR